MLTEACKGQYEPDPRGFEKRQSKLGPPDNKVWTDDPQGPFPILGTAVAKEQTIAAASLRGFCVIRA